MEGWLSRSVYWWMLQAAAADGKGFHQLVSTETRLIAQGAGHFFLAGSSHSGTFRKACERYQARPLSKTIPEP